MLTNTRIAYKLVRKMANGELKPLFIDKTTPFVKGEWLESECHPTKGFAVRQGWHCCFKPVAPHLSERNRVWIEVLVQNYQSYSRPESQGGSWILADKMKVLREVPQNEVEAMRG